MNAKTEQPIVGKVARILNRHELVINRGESHGVEVGQYFAVYDKNPEDIVDPDTGELIGRVLRPKVRVQVKSVAERYAVAETFQEFEENLGGEAIGLSGLSDLFSPPNWVKSVETLRTDEATWETLPESDSIVKTGDEIRQIDKPEDGAALLDFVPAN